MAVVALVVRVPLPGEVLWEPTMTGLRTGTVITSLAIALLLRRTVDPDS